MRQFLLFVVLWIAGAQTVFAQQLNIATITRPPFSMVEDGQDTGFSIDLWQALATDLGLDFDYQRVENFGEMLNLVEAGQVDAAVANISITATRETVMDFSQPIFESGLHIMVQSSGGSGFSVLRAFFSPEVLSAVFLAFALLFGAGMLMWRFERKAQPYFEIPAKEAMFPAFWWALNLIVNGGFEERAPRTPAGRLFGVILVISSLFFVSVFVAKITAVLTVDAIQNNVNSVNDLYGKRIATISGSTASTYLEARDLRFTGYEDLDTMIAAFEDGSENAVVFDAPILAFYVASSNNRAELAGSIFQRENYGIALPSNSPLAEQINQSLLKLRENGVYNSIYRDWFGANPDS